MTRRAISFGEDGPEQAIYLQQHEDVGAFIPIEDFYEVPDDIAALYDNASRAWDEAQERIQAWFKVEEAKYPSGALEALLCQNITREQFDARVGGCTHASRSRFAGPPDHGMRPANADEAGYCDTCAEFVDGVA